MFFVGKRCLPYAKMARQLHVRKLVQTLEGLPACCSQDWNLHLLTKVSNQKWWYYTHDYKGYFMNVVGIYNLQYDIEIERHKLVLCVMICN